MADHHTVAHAWANQTGRNCNGPSMFYDGDTIYSYGRHFAIARLVPAGNGTAVLFTTAGYSNTTAKHKSAVRDACRHLTRFDVPDPASRDHAANYESMVRSAAGLVEQAGKARTRGDRLLSEASDALQMANRYAALFGLARDVLTLESLGVAVAKLDARMKRAKAKAERERKAAEAARFKAQEEQRQAWLDGSSAYYHGTDAKGGALLRVMGDQLETSQGVAVPLRHAVLAFRFVKLVRERGAGWRRNGHVIRVGHFQVDSIDASGNLVAGCHRIGWPEIERIARHIGVFESAPSDEVVEANAMVSA